MSTRSTTSTTMVQQMFDKVLNLEKIGKGLYRSTYQIFNKNGRSVFGGHVIALGLLAAGDTIKSDYNLHSFHCYFLKPGKDKPIIYKVESTREGKSYCSRGVKAVQNGQDIFTMQCSFKKSESDEYDFQIQMPAVPKPDSLKSKGELLQELSEQGSTPKKLTNSSNSDFVNRSIERKLVNQNYFNCTKQPNNLVWIRFKEPLNAKQLYQQVLAAFVSDLEMHLAATNPKHIPGDTWKFFVTSIDHSMWFYKPVKLDEWLLFEIESPVTGQGRGFTTARVWSEDGSLIMHITQEIVARSLRSQL